MSEPVQVAAEEHRIGRGFARVLEVLLKERVPNSTKFSAFREDSQRGRPHLINRTVVQ
jgi:hypothetical protein